MWAHMLESYLLISGLFLIVSPAVAAADIWRNFHRRNPATLLRKSGGRAVLVLRNFAGDESDPSYIAFGGGFRTPRRIEIALGKQIRSPLGPLVTLGSPEDFSPPAGALRTYATADDWKGKVSRYLELAGFVVLIVRSWSEHLLWEMHTVRWRVPPNRTVVILVHANHWTRGDDCTSGCDLIVFGGPDKMATCSKSSELPVLTSAVCDDQMSGTDDLHARMNVLVGETFHPPSPDPHRQLEGVLVLGFGDDWSPIIVTKKIGDVFRDEPKDYPSLADRVWSRLG